MAPVEAVEVGDECESAPGNEIVNDCCWLVALSWPVVSTSSEINDEDSVLDEDIGGEEVCSD